MKTKSKILIVFCGVFLVVFLMFFFTTKKEITQGNSPASSLVKNAKENRTKEILETQQYCSFFPKRRREDYVFNANEKAGMAVLFDRTGKETVLYQKNIDEKLPIASITKLMSAIVVLDNYDLDRVVEVSKKAVDAPEIVGKLKPGEKITIRGLLELSLIVSSNDAAQALAEVMGEEKFIEKMNEKAKEIGLLNTHFVSAHGYEPENQSSAKDLVLLAQYSRVNYPLIWEILSKKQATVIGSDPFGGEIIHNLNNTNKLLSENYVIGGKTGYTDEAGDTMILVMKAPGIVEGDVVLVLLGLGIAERIPKMKNFYDWIMWGWDWGNLKEN